MKTTDSPVSHAQGSENHLSPDNRPQPRRELLIQKLESSYQNFLSECRDMPPETLIETAESITCIKIVYNFLKRLPTEYLEYFARFSDPLIVVLHQSANPNIFLGASCQIAQSIANISTRRNLDHLYEIDPDYLG